MIDSELKISVHHIVPPDIECMYDCCKFQIMCCIVLFMILELPGFIANHIFSLHQNSSEAFDASISAHHGIFIGIENLENGSTGEQFFQLLEASFTLFGPMEFDVLLMQIIDTMCYLQEPLYEFVVVSYQDYKSPNIYYVLGHRPFQYHCNIFRICHHAFFRDNVSHVLNLFLVEASFTDLGVQLLLSQDL